MQQEMPAKSKFEYLPFNGTNEPHIAERLERYMQKAVVCAGASGVRVNGVRNHGFHNARYVLFC
jgi:hypothetical protein